MLEILPLLRYVLSRLIEIFELSRVSLSCLVLALRGECERRVKQRCLRKKFCLI